MTNARPASGILRCVLAMAGVVAFTLIVSAQPAGASNLTATNSRSVILSIEPTDPAVMLGVIGGDVALRVRAEPGHEVIVLGYEMEPYLRIAADGATSVNRRSPARALNETRTGTRTDSAADSTAAPEWISLDGSGEVVWHDHRIHSMTPADDGHEWTVALLIDGRRVDVNGELRLEPAPSPVPWLALIVGLVMFGVLLGRRRSQPDGTIAAITGSLLSLAMAVILVLDTPAQLGRQPLPILLTGVAYLCSMVALLLTGRGRRIAVAASLALSAGFLTTVAKNLVSAYVPMIGPAVAARAIVATAIAAVIIGVVLLIIGSGRPSAQADESRLS